VKLVYVSTIKTGDIADQEWPRAMKSDSVMADVGGGGDQIRYARLHGVISQKTVTFMEAAM
jgi:hypothetical protein